MQIRKNGFTFFSVSLWACVFYALPFLVQSSTAIAIVVVVVVLPRVVCIFKIIAKHISMFEYLHTKCTHSYAQTERNRKKRRAPKCMLCERLYFSANPFSLCH